MQGKRLLIIEDSVDYTLLLKRLFSRRGFAVATAEHGQQALDYLESCQELPHLILLDLMMPVMDGHEFHRRQLADPKLSKIPVVLMTAHGNIASEKSSMKIFESLQKPVDMDRLIEVVGRATA